MGTLKGTLENEKAVYRLWENICKLNIWKKLVSKNQSQNSTAKTGINWFKNWQRAWINIPQKT